MSIIQLTQFKGINEAVDSSLLNEEGQVVNNASVRYGN